MEGDRHLQQRLGDSFNKFYQLKNNGDGTYDLQVNYRNGTLVTVAGTSPGACEATGTNAKRSVPVSPAG